MNDMLNVLSDIYQIMLPVLVVELRGTIPTILPCANIRKILVTTSTVSTVLNYTFLRIKLFALLQ